MGTIYHLLLKTSYAYGPLCGISTLSYITSGCILGSDAVGFLNILWPKNYESFLFQLKNSDFFKVALAGLLTILKTRKFLQPKEGRQLVCSRKHKRKQFPQDTRCIPIGFTKSYFPIYWEMKRGHATRC